MIILFSTIILIIILVILNGYFSLSEIALLSVKKSRLRLLAKEGNPKAVSALALVQSPSEMLSTVQIGITAIGVLAGAFSGATIAEYLESYLARFSTIAPYSEAASVITVVIVITYFSIVIGELVPKQIALSNPEKISLAVAQSIRYIMKISAPLVKILSLSNTILLRLFKITPVSEQTISEEEIKLLIAEGTERGVFEKAEQKMVESVFHIGSRPIKDFMTPRNQVVWLDTRDPLSVVKNKITGSDRSVFPVCDGTLDNNLGAVEVKDILTRIFKETGQEIPLKDLLQPVIRIDGSVPTLVAIGRLKRSAISIALITEKSTKAIIGIISSHDILEALVGDFKNT